jgi:RimJ/RimL family protein N-acetyltransferase
VCDAVAMSDLVSYWPLFGLRVAYRDLELRVPTDDDLGELIEVARAGVHPPEHMPFLSPWTERSSPEFERGFLQYHWRLRGAWTPGDWSFDFAVRRDGALVGCQALMARDFAVTRTVQTGSWLGQAHQGQGIGTGMRHAVLALAFDGLGAVEAQSGAFTDNPQSAAVSRKLGYRECGHLVHVRRGERAVEERFVLTRDDWEARGPSGVEITGLDACRDLFGAAS